MRETAEKPTLGDTSLGERYRFSHTATVTPKEQTSDLERVSTLEASLVAHRFREKMESFDFCRLSELLRCDHSSSPIANASRSFIEDDIDHLQGSALTAAEAQGMKFFLLGKPVSHTVAAEILGEDLITQGIDLELFRVNASGLVELNNLILCAHSLDNGETIFFFADTPNYLPTQRGDQRVYSGMDSYLLNTKLQSYVDLNGVVAEMGSGSGLQLITLLKSHSGIERGIGVEIDARARNLSQFNAALNGVEDRFEIVSDQTALAAALSGQRISLGFSNPPFIAAPREIQAFDKTEERAISLDLKALFPSAGWGGHDGLRITRKFIDILKQHLSPNGEILIYSQFTGTDGAPVQILDLAEEEGFSACAFETFPKSSGYHMSAPDWGAYISKHTMTLHPELPREAQTWLFAATVEMLSKQGITHLHSGFATLRLNDKRELEKDQPNEDSLKLYSALRGSSGLLRSFDGMIPQEDRVQPPRLGTGKYYCPPSRPIEERWNDSPNPLFQGELYSAEGRYTLTVHEDGNSFQFRVRDSKGELVESGVVPETTDNHSRFSEILESIHVVEPIKLLRRWQVEQAGIVPAALVNQSIGTHFSGDLLIEAIPVTHSFRVSRWHELAREDGTRERQPPVYSRYPMTSSQGLRLNALMRRERSAWKL
ncbi:MAG: hypothetical protein KDD64_04025 [Bdellovibrionales bacterium]|nr:hypothetical protein [Bdellovibrionales bacterium]